MANSSPSEDVEAQISDLRRNRSGWITFPFIISSAIGLTLAGSGWQANMVVYLIQEFHVKSMTATRVSNIIYGCSNLIPVLGGLLADSFLGCFYVILSCAAGSLLGMVLLVLTTSFHSLRPAPCANEPTNSCYTSTSPAQFAVLYAGIALGCIGMGGTRFTMATMGANQLKKNKDREIFFNWYFFVLYASAVIGSTMIVYVEDSINWGWGFGICLGANFIAFTALLVGNRYFRQVKPQGSPFTSLAQVFVAAIRKIRMPMSYERENYYYGVANTKTTPTLEKGLRFLNRAAVITEGDIQIDKSIAKPWRLTTVQQVQDLKTLLKIFPLWSTSIFLCTPIAINNSLVVLQALTMDRQIGVHIKIPAGTMLVFVILSSAISLPIIDRLLYPGWKKLMNRYPSALQRIGIGHLINLTGMVASALVETKRLNLVRTHHLQQKLGSVVPMLVLWLVPQLALIGIAEAFHFAGQVAFYYKEYPVALRSTATAMQAVTIAVSYYLSSLLLGLTQRITGWLPDNINSGRLDNVYWMLTVVAGLNFVYYLICAKLYNYQNTEKVENPASIENKTNVNAEQNRM